MEAKKLPYCLVNVHLSSLGPCRHRFDSPWSEFLPFFLLSEKSDTASMEIDQKAIKTGAAREAVRSAHIDPTPILRHVHCNMSSEGICRIIAHMTAVMLVKNATT